MIREDGVDREFRVRGKRRICVPIAGQLDQGDGQCPAAPPGPSCIVDRQPRAERRAGLTGKEVPSNDQVASGIANAQAAKVYHAYNTSIRNKQIAGRQVSMDPDGFAAPCCRIEVCVPSGRDGGDVD